MSAEMERLRVENERLRRQLDEGLLRARKMREACLEAGGPVVPVAVAEAMSDLTAWRQRTEERVCAEAKARMAAETRASHGQRGGLPSVA